MIRSRTVTFGYQDRRREDLELAGLEVLCQGGRIRAVFGRDPQGGTFVHPEPETLAFVLDRGSGIAYPRHEMPVPHAPEIGAPPARRSAGAA